MRCFPGPPGSSQIVILIVVTLVSYYLIPQQGCNPPEFLFMKTVREVEIAQCLQHFRAVKTLISIIIENLGESGFIELSRCISYISVCCKCCKF